MERRWFGDKCRAQMGQHWELRFRESRQLKHALKKRRNPFIKRPWLARTVDRYGRPRNHPLFQNPQNSD